MTGADALRDAADALARAGVSDPAGDARRLLSYALGPDVPHHAVTARLETALSDHAAARFQAAIAARARRQPVSQITGGRDFWKHRFIVTPDTLDPRPDTETLVEQALNLRWTSVLDLGTGTGAILISLLAERPDATGLGTDLSPAALAVARRNADAIGIKVDLRLSDWFENVSGHFDLIVSNPPYIALQEMADLEPEVKSWEPVCALTDGGDGLSAYRVIAAGARAHLTADGHVVCEIGHLQGSAVLEIFRAQDAEAYLFRDLNGHGRVIVANFSC